MLIGHQLDAAHISTSQFATFLEVRAKINHGALDVSAAWETAEAKATALLHNFLQSEPA